LGSERKSTGEQDAPSSSDAGVIRSRTRHPLPRRDEFRGIHDLSLFEALGGRLPSALAIVTGPSRSGDIEQQQVVGVHRPGEGQVVLTSLTFEG